MIPNFTFYPYKPKGESKVYLRLKIGALKDFRLSTGQTILEASEWNKKTGLPKENTVSNKRLKKNLIQLEDEIREHIDKIEKGLINGFITHNKAVRETIPKEQLLVFQVKEGWEPLCKFLNVPVPDEPFPRSNNREEFWELVNGGN